MNGLKFDKGKADWHLVPIEYFISMAAFIKPFIKMYMLKKKEIIFNRSHIYNIIRSNIAQWYMERNYRLGDFHPLMGAMIGTLMLADPRKYSYEEVFSTSKFVQRWDLINPEWTTKIVEIYTYGANKYNANNWQNVELHRYYSALNRHLEQYWKGDIYDVESGFQHLYHAAWNCISIMWLEKNRKKEKSL